MKQTCILVMGMHRSGTSALTGLLEIMGVSLGEDLIDASDDNKKGFFENKNFLDFNKSFLNDYHTPLEVMNFSVDIVSGKNESVSILKEKLKKIFKGKQTFAIKDPRITYIFELYQTALSELNIDVVCIVPIRYPLEVAQSLKKRNNFSINRALLMWAEHILLTEKVTRQYSRVFLDFDAYLNNPKKEILLLSEIPGIKFTKDFYKQEDEIKEFLDSNLKHNIKKTSDGRLPNIVKKILNIKLGDYNNQSKLFDNLFDEFNSYKELFYNQDVKHEVTLRQKENEELCSNLREVKEASTLRQKKTEQGLQKRTEELEQSKQQLSATEQGLQQRTEELAQSKQQLSETEQGLQQRTQELTQSKQQLSEKEQILFQRNQEINAFKEELITIYTSKSWKVTRILRKLKRLFK